jgi:hypothetical protein
MITDLLSFQETTDNLTSLFFQTPQSSQRTSCREFKFEESTTKVQLLSTNTGTELQILFSVPKPFIIISQTLSVLKAVIFFSKIG